MVIINCDFWALLGLSIYWEKEPCSCYHHHTPHLKKNHCLLFQWLPVKQFLSDSLDDFAMYKDFLKWIKRLVVGKGTLE